MGWWGGGGTERQAGKSADAGGDRQIFRDRKKVRQRQTEAYTERKTLRQTDILQPAKREVAKGNEYEILERDADRYVVRDRQIIIH